MKKHLVQIIFILLLPLATIAQDFHTLNNQFIALYEKGNYTAAIPVGIKALAQGKKEFGINHVNYAIAADNLANASYMLSHFQDAIFYFKDAKRAYTTAVGDAEIVEVGLCNNAIGNCFYQVEKYDSALKHYVLAYQYFKGYPQDQYANLVVSASNYNKVLSLYDQNKEVQLVCENILPVIDSIEGRQCENYYNMLTYYGMSLRDQEMKDKAIICFEEAVTLAAGLYGKKHVEYASALNLLADVYKNQARFAEAEALALEAQRILLALDPPDFSSLANGYHALANLYGEIAQYEKAYRYYDTALALLVNAHLDGEELYSTIMRSYSYTCVDGGRLSEARKLLTKVKEIYETKYGPMYAPLGEVYITLGNISFQMNELTTATLQLKKAATIIEINEGKESFLMSRAYEIEGLVLHKMGNSSKGLVLCQKAADMNTNILGEMNAFTASSLSNVGLIYQETGDFAKAEEVLRHSFNIRQKVYGLDHPQTALSMANLATVMMAQSRYADADKLLAAALEILKGRGLIASSVALTVINNIALMSQQQGEIATAKTLYLRVLEMLKTEKEQNGLVYGTVINNLSIISMEDKNYEEALMYSKQAMDYAQQTQGKYSITYIKAANNQLVIYSKMNQYEPGIKLVGDLLTICKKTLGDSAQLMGTIYSNYASLEAKAGHIEKAAALMMQSLSIQMAHYERNLYALSERDQVAWWQQQAFAFQMLPSLLLASNNMDKSKVSAMINQQLQLKGIILNNATASLRKARSINDPQLQMFIDQWQSSRSLYLQQSSIPVAERIYNIDSLQVMSNNFEQAINKKTGTQLLAKQTTVSWQQVQQSLAPQEAAVEFFRYPKFTNNWFSDTLYYGAIIITKNATPEVVSLGNEKSIQWCFSGGNTASKEANISKLYRSKIKSKATIETTFTGDSLYKLIWQPLLPFLKNATTVSYAPDGLLHEIAFAALPNGDGTLLLDSFQLQQYSSVRQLTTRDLNPIDIKTVFAAGHAAFNAGNNNNDNNTWSDLPGTKKELETLSKIFSGKGIKITTLDSTKATEENFKALSNKAPSIIHIATHGFFLPDPPTTKTAEQITTGENMFAVALDPLMRSGIILAGANKNWNSMQISSGKEDGIVTAYEIAQLNLNGTALAVLSACETGLGDVQDSEGVFGLQRALKMAGIKNLILSLWEVPDEETMELMTNFYGNVLAGKPIRQSFYEAQKAMRVKYPPFAWSAFVLME